MKSYYGEPFAPTRNREFGMADFAHAPQLITDARMLYLVWRPADPAAAAALVPDELAAVDGSLCYMNQYVVDDEAQISSAGEPDSFGAYSLTYLGLDLAGLDTEEGVPARWWTHYMNSSEAMNRYAAAHGVPVSAGRTELDLDGRTLTATTLVDGRPIIRTVCDVVIGETARGSGQLRYITRVDGGLVSGRYPFVADFAEVFSVTSLEFVDPSHPTSVLQPADPLEVTFGFYSPGISFCYPGGEGPLGSVHGS
jgi:hypothetical protein